MTVIVGIVDNGKIWMGGDRCASSPNVKALLAAPKVFIKQVGIRAPATLVVPPLPVLFGWCGSPRIGQLLQHCDMPCIPEEGVMHWVTITLPDHVRALCKNHGVLRSENGLDTMAVNSALLIGIYGQLFQMEENLQVIQNMEQEDAAGSGAEYALGSLYTTRRMELAPKYRVELALESALQNPFVAGPFDILSI
jgi:hypothetical protein